MVEYEMAGNYSQMASAPTGREIPDSEGSDSRGCCREYGIRGRAGSGGEDSGDPRPDRTTRFVETTRGVLSYTELAPLLAERVARTELALSNQVFASFPLDDFLVCELHRWICGDLVPEWGGKWRVIEVAVGNLTPSASHLVPQHMRDYGRDLQARWSTSEEDPTLTLELLAFAEGRFLTIHPFQDFNGRTIRVFLLEILRRLDFPRVVLAPQDEEGRAHYFKALEAADRNDWQPLIEIWKERLAAAQ